jgi:hypothetical protein
MPLLVGGAAVALVAVVIVLVVVLRPHGDGAESTEAAVSEAIAPAEPLGGAPVLTLVASAPDPPSSVGVSVSDGGSATLTIAVSPGTDPTGLEFIVVRDDGQFWPDSIPGASGPRLTLPATGEQTSATVEGLGAGAPLCVSVSAKAGSLLSGSVVSACSGT